MRLSEAQFGDRVRLPISDVGNLIYTTNDSNSSTTTEATVLYTSDKCVVLWWGTNELPPIEGSHPKRVFDNLKQRGFIPQSFEEPTNGYAAYFAGPSLVDCELVFRKADWDKRTTLHNAKVGDRVILPVDAKNEVILDTTKAVGTTTGTVLITDGLDWYPKIGWRKGDNVPKNAKMQEVYGGFIACASLSVNARNVPCIILPPEEVKEPKETPKAKSEEVKVEPTQEVSTSKDTIVIDSLYLLQPEQEPTAQDHKESSFTPAIMIGAGIFGGLISAMVMMKPNIEARVEAIAETNDEPAEANELQTDVI
jgi:hypothetical protein